MRHGIATMLKEWDAVEWSLIGRNELIAIDLRNILPNTRAIDGTTASEVSNLRGNDEYD